jgi:hypothetical protein
VPKKAFAVQLRGASEGYKPDLSHFDGVLVLQSGKEFFMVVVAKMRGAFVCVCLGLALSGSASAQMGSAQPRTQASVTKAMKKAAKQQKKDQKKNAKAQQEALKHYKKIHGITR